MSPFYGPQRSCGQGNVFTGVCLSTGREGICLSACWDANPPGPGRPPWDQAEHPPLGPGRTPPGTRQTPPNQADHPPDQADHPPGTRQTPPWDQADTPQNQADHPPSPPSQEADSSIRSTTSGRYGSYWNAFLFKLYSIVRMNGT